MFPESFSEWVSGLFTRFNYIAPFTVLLLCGVGFPLPEEVTLIGSGILLHKEMVTFERITLTCATAILLGDSIPFWLGRRWGMSALQHRWMRRILHPERLSKLEKRFTEHGNWATFVCRFFPGVRIPGYFLAGTMRMSYPRFILLDAVGVLISVPASIYLGKIFGHSMEQLKSSIHDLHLILGFLLVTVILIVVWRSRARRKPEPPPPPAP
ncbi:MAG: DedA family protein [Planctomycetota bacterium]